MWQHTHSNPNYIHYAFNTLTGGAGDLTMVLSVRLEVVLLYVNGLVFVAFLGTLHHFNVIQLSIVVITSYYLPFLYRGRIITAGWRGGKR